MSHRFDVDDDSGFLALVDHHAYPGFLGGDWTYDTLFAHFRAAMAERSLLLWETGREDEWSVDVRIDQPAPDGGFRRTVGPIRVSAGQLLVTNYESLTMAAQFPDVRLPETDQRTNVLDVASGVYSCEIVQFEDPDDERASHATADFVLTLAAGRDIAPWRRPAWHDS